MMKLPETLKSIGYAIVFGFTGLIIGIWMADVLYMLILKNMDRVTTIYISLILIILIAASTSFIGFTKGKKWLE